MSVTVKCPKCEAEIDHFCAREEGVYYSNMSFYMGDYGLVQEPYDESFDAYSEEGRNLIISCPECQKELFYDWEVCEEWIKSNEKYDIKKGD